MGARLARSGAGGSVDGVGVANAFEAEGLRPRTWSNGPGDTYGWHRHDYEKVLVCLAGGIVFHVGHEAGTEDVALGPGDRLELDPGTDHAATVGPTGVTCIEAPRPREP